MTRRCQRRSAPRASASAPCQALLEEELGGSDGVGRAGGDLGGQRPRLLQRRVGDAGDEPQSRAHRFPKLSARSWPAPWRRRWRTSSRRSAAPPMSGTSPHFTSMTDSRASGVASADVRAQGELETRAEAVAVDRGNDRAPARRARPCSSPGTGSGMGRTVTPRPRRRSPGCRARTSRRARRRTTGLRRGGSLPAPGGPSAGGGPRRARHRAWAGPCRCAGRDA